MKKNSFKGILCLPVTPFTKNDEIDEPALRQIVEKIITDGADALVPTGATGEFPHLLHEERQQIWKIVLDHTNGRIPVLAGTGGISIKESLMFTKQAKDIGCDGVMLSHPILFKTTDDETYNYFEAIASKVDIPILMYNNPGLGRTMSPNVIERLADNFENVVSYKEDDFNNDRFARVIYRCRKKISIFIGNPAVYLSFLSHGAHGALIAQFQAFPHLMLGLKHSFEQGDSEKTMYYHEMIMRMFDIIDTNFAGTSFAGYHKAIWRLRGADLDLRVRGPQTPARPDQLEKARADFLTLDIPENWYLY
jgi:4-hydroxy-tetrahydrodipicolinate synthase